MRRLAFMVALASSFAGPACLLGACGIGTGGLGPGEDAAVPHDTGPDVAVESGTDDGVDSEAVIDTASEAQPPPIPSCGSCGGACCSDQCTFRNCPDCDAGAILCPFALSSQGSNGYCIGSCAECAPNGIPAPVTCYTCGSGIVLGRCAASVGDCPQNLAGGACPCLSGDAGECPGPNQVCTTIDGGGPICLPAVAAH